MLGNNTAFSGGADPFSHLGENFEVDFLPVGEDGSGERSAGGRRHDCQLQGAVAGGPATVPDVTQSAQPTTPRATAAPRPEGDETDRSGRPNHR